MPPNERSDPFTLPGAQGEYAVFAFIGAQLKRIADDMSHINYVLTRMVFDDGSLRVSSADDHRRNEGMRWE